MNPFKQRGCFLLKKRTGLLVSPIEISQELREAPLFWQKARPGINRPSEPPECWIPFVSNSLWKVSPPYAASDQTPYAVSRNENHSVKPQPAGKKQKILPFVKRDFRSLLRICTRIICLPCFLVTHHLSVLRCSRTTDRWSCTIFFFVSIQI